MCIRDRSLSVLGLKSFPADVLGEYGLESPSLAALGLKSFVVLSPVVKLDLRFSSFSSLSPNLLLGLSSLALVVLLPALGLPALDLSSRLFLLSLIHI